ncbi:hypothetical protein B0O99DRAFT_601775 [Bisporella sp. PMI_857]|nr:hypothetical protein B0O99DRAFT_601775 [Bisporella sp. PMI_857]
MSMVWSSQRPRQAQILCNAAKIRWHYTVYENLDSPSPEMVTTSFLSSVQEGEIGTEVQGDDKPSHWLLSTQHFYWLGQKSIWKRGVHVFFIVIVGWFYPWAPQFNWIEVPNYNQYESCISELQKFKQDLMKEAGDLAVADSKMEGLDVQHEEAKEEYRYLTCILFKDCWLDEKSILSLFIYGISGQAWFRRAYHQGQNALALRAIGRMFWTVQMSEEDQN